ncbi:acid-sensing ion channel 4 [Caerostris extrusa]|uniref:Acid-sensing ion channel 4 n=1 Tax=Caerostris extrusa TaxID=172846 RepID=A0AAV4QU79_CAEEX|nr:acid-sensing ion channel 4 [Caerostris extrusa]
MHEHYIREENWNSCATSGRDSSPPSPLLISEEPECYSGVQFRMKHAPPNQRHNKRSHKGQTESKAKLKIFYESLDHTTYTQRAMFSDSELYAHLGGHLGLWLGLSCIALFE